MKKAIILGTLLCSSLLVGCSNKKENNSTKRETNITKSLSQDSSTNKSSESTDTSSITEESIQQSQIPTSVTEQDFDFDAINNGNFSSAAGTWKNKLGDTMNLNNDGTGIITSQEGNQSPFKIIDFKDGIGQYAPINTKEPLGGSGAFFMKISEEPKSTFNVKSDINRPRIDFGQSEPLNDDRFFYRAS